MKNGQTADPLNVYAKAVAEISKKRNKTEADHMELSRREFFGALYIDQNGPFIPAVNIRKAIEEAAKKSKKGAQVRAGVFVNTNGSLEYEGPRDRDGLWEAEMYDRRPVGVQKAKTARTRPKFENWSCTFEIEVLEDQASLEDVQEWLEIAGRLVGLGDYRPASTGTFGRFTVERI
jgi:hypothetical protein